MDEHDPYFKAYKMLLQVRNIYHNIEGNRELIRAGRKWRLLCGTGGLVSILTTVASCESYLNLTKNIQNVEQFVYVNLCGFSSMMMWGFGGAFLAAGTYFANERVKDAKKEMIEDEQELKNLESKLEEYQSLNGLYK